MMLANIFRSALGKNLFQLALWGAGLASISMMVWTLGPLIEIGGYRPLQSYLVREAVILIITAAVAGGVGLHFYRRKKSSEQLVEGIGSAAPTESDGVVLKEKMKDALATLKKAGGGNGDHLYDLPWYLLIGPPGAGKTTALVNSGLKFPLSRGATPAAVAGVGGTRYCDWWFTEDAVLIDTAGRYTTQDSDARADQQSWFSFLDLLKKNRPRQPINGVLVAISLEDLMVMSTAEINAHSNAIRARLLELHDRLKVDFPVYALFTKADLVAGFMEFFGNLGENGRKQVWGATFQTNDKTRNLVGEVPFEFDALIERLNVDLTDRLQEEPVPSTRVALFGFPAQMAALKGSIFDFLNSIFEPTRYHANATLRGFYFTSGTQEGTPIDQVIGALARSFGAEEVSGAKYSGKGRSFFLTDLINRAIIGEAAWVSTDWRAVRRAMIVKTAVYTCIFAFSAAAIAAWWASYRHNKDLIAQTETRIEAYRAAAGPLASEKIISDRAFEKAEPLLRRLRLLPAGYASRGTTVPWTATFGLSQYERLHATSENAYRVALERMFRSRLIYRLEEVLEANRTNPGFLYEALKVYIMLGGLQPIDRDLVTSWMRRDWSDNLYPGAGNAAGRKALEDHLAALLDLEAGQEPLITLHGPLIEETQKTLARLSVSQRAYELLKSQARSSQLADWVPARQSGPDFGLVFQAAGGQDVESVRVEGFFTYAGFRRAFVERLGDIAEQVKRERWVLGPAGEQSAVSAQYDSLGQGLLDLYGRDFAATWRTALGRLQLRALTTDKPKYIALGAAAAATSPIKQLLESIRDETALTRERPGFNKPAAGASAAEAAPALLKQQGQAPGATIEAAFKAFHVLVEGDATRRPIDAIIANLNEIHQSLTLLATNPSQAAMANSALQTQVASLRANANRLPAPFADLMLKAAGSFEGDLTNSSHAQLTRALGDQVTGTCQQIVPNRYPFTRGSTQDVPLADFGRLFSPGGIIDRFFAQNLQTLVDTSQRDWAWRQDNALARTLSPATLREFQRAAQIRDAFFSTGGNMPSISLAVTAPPSANGMTAKLDINGTVVESKPGSNAPVAVPWPGAGTNRTAITVGQDLGGQQLQAQPSRLAFGAPASPPLMPATEPSVLERQGTWSLFRMLDAAGPTRQGDRIGATFIVGGMSLQYRFGAGSVHNPLSLPALREFRCPSGI
jgi:type VI secretion system protein ImpL